MCSANTTLFLHEWHKFIYFWCLNRCAVDQSCPALCDPMECSKPGVLVLHYLPKFAQTKVHWVMLSKNLTLCHSLLLQPLIFPSMRVFINESALHIRCPKYWTFSISPSNNYSGWISFRIDWFDFFAVQGTLKSSPAPQFESLNSSALTLLYGPVLTAVCDYWKNHSLDYTDVCQKRNVSTF